MLLLFNSAYRLGYTRNVLRTFFLPSGAPNDFRYSIGKELHVSAKFVESIQQKLRGKSSVKVLICFADRFSDGGYTFHPIRMGALIKVEEAGSRAYFKVQLEKYVTCKSPTDFSRQLYSNASSAVGDDRLLSLTNNDTQCERDGRYAFWMEDDTVEPLLQDGDHAWREAAERISKANIFQSDKSTHFVFAKCELIVDGRIQFYKRSEHTPCFKLRRNQEAKVRVSYYFPLQNEDSKSSAAMSVAASTGVAVLASPNFSLDMRENKIDVPIVFEPRSENTFFTIAFAFSPKDETAELFAAQESISIRVQEPIVRQVSAVAAIFLYALGAYLSSTGCQSWGEAFKGIALAVMFFALGKKIV
jgi:hypothetical protein